MHWLPRSVGRSKEGKFKHAGIFSHHPVHLAVALPNIKHENLIFSLSVLYWVAGQDGAQETEKWVEWAALASATDSAISCVTSCPATQ